MLIIPSSLVRMPFGTYDLVALIVAFLLALLMIGFITWRLLDDLV